MSADLLKKRYLAKLFANLIGVGIGLFSQALIVRGLGPKAYGDFGFLSNIFNRVVGFLDMGTSNGFYTKLSQRQNDFTLVSFYVGLFSGFTFALLIIFTLFLHLTGYYKTILPDQKLLFIYMCMFFAFLTWFVQILNKTADAYGITVYTEIARIIQKIMGFSIIAALFFTNQLSLFHFFLYHYVILAILAIAIICVAEYKGHSFRRNWKLSYDKIKAYTGEFYHYSHPLFVASLVVLVVGIFDHWMLQKFGGSVQQGYYFLAYQIGAIYYLFTSAMTPLIMREFSISFGKNDLSEMARLFSRYIPVFIAITAYFGCFGALQAEKVIFLLGGDKYAEAVIPVIIMSLFPVYQALGQFTSSVFFSTGQTKLYRNIGVFSNVIGIPFCFFLLAPEGKWGLGAGAAGLAIKITVLTFVSVNVKLYFCTRFLELRFWRYVCHHVICVGCLLCIAMIARVCVDRGLALECHIVFSFVLSGILYTFIVFVLACYLPVVFGLKKNDLRLLLDSVTKKIRIRKV